MHLQPTIRLLTPLDISQALSLSQEAGWNQTAGDWELLLNLAPQGCFAVEQDGRVVSTAALVAYGRRLGWLGMVLTRHDSRRRGFARALVAHVLELAESRNLESIQLDATEYGHALYESFGFRVQQRVERWSGRGGKLPDGPGCQTVRLEEVVAVEEFLALDGEAFGVGRAGLLRALARNGNAIGDSAGFLFQRDGLHARYLGPCIARTPDLARELIVHCLSGAGQKWFWDLLPANADAVAIAKDLGFEAVRRLVRMYRGAIVPSLASQTYAIAGFELG